MESIVHTPGPWRQGGVKEFLLNNKCREIVADDGKIGLVYGISDEDNKANAQLIAAAPAMKELLLDFCDSLGDNDCIPTHRQMLAKKAALALLAKVV
jgi:hypothetical protein